MPYFLKSARSRGAPTRGPNSPREIQPGVVCPREMNPEIASKSNVRQTMCLAMGADYSFAMMAFPATPTALKTHARTSRPELARTQTGRAVARRHRGDAEPRRGNRRREDS